MNEIVFIGLSLSSSWGNGHATTYRALLRGLNALGHRALFLERDVPWYAANRDLSAPDFCELAFYDSPEALADRFASRIETARAVVIGSYVPDGRAILDLVLARAKGSVAFYDIDTPITVAALEAGADTYISPTQIPALDLYFSFTGGPMLDRLRDRFGARRPQALYCAVDDSYGRRLDETQRWDLGYLGTYSDDRQPVLDRLLLEPARRMPDSRFVVAGPQYPAGIAWPTNVERIEHLGPADHLAFYAAQRFTLNVTRSAMVEAGWSPSVRLFEAAACGTPIISDRWAGLTTIFSGAIIVADGTNNVIEALTTMSETDCRRIGATARALVLAQHTGVSRARAFLQALDSIRGL